MVLEHDEQDEGDGDDSPTSCEIKLGLRLRIQEDMVEEEDGGDTRSHLMSQTQMMKVSMQMRLM